MLLTLLGTASMFAAAHFDTVASRTVVATPTVHSTPIVGIGAAVMADSIVVEKSKRTLTLYLAGAPVRSYRVALGKQPVGDKIRIGDNRTPEGMFFIDAKNPDSRYHRALHISYPDAAHLARASKLGVKPGNNIMVHGLPDQYASLGKEHRTFDWTEGCIAVTNREIEEIWRAIPMGAAIQIKP
ncbi:MAG TPA: L,D-transpeptidase family protein [Gemmatimonadaceae bacterium]